MMAHFDRNLFFLILRDASHMRAPRFHLGRVRRRGYREVLDLRRLKRGFAAS